MSLTLYCQLDIVEEAGRDNATAAPVDPAPEAALGSLSSVALSSARVGPSVPQMAEARLKIRINEITSYT